MLDKELCKLFGIDEYQQYLVNELENYEDMLNSDWYSNEYRDSIRREYQALKRALEQYCNFKKRKGELPHSCYSKLNLDEIIFLNHMKIKASEKGISVEEVFNQMCKEENLSAEEYIKLYCKFFPLRVLEKKK